MTDTIRYYVAGNGREYFPSEAEAIAAAKERDRCEHVYREIESGTYVSAQRIWPTVGELHAD